VREIHIEVGDCGVEMFEPLLDFGAREPGGVVARVRANGAVERRKRARQVAVAPVQARKLKPPASISRLNGYGFLQRGNSSRIVACRFGSLGVVRIGGGDRSRLETETVARKTR
jgi:hypothetical protein